MLMTDSYSNYLNFLPFFFILQLWLFLRILIAGEIVRYSFRKKNHNLQQCFNYVTKIDRVFLKISCEIRIGRSKLK